jgi:tRNA threonylcarbamoyladenosine biosynthesis protein TsaE
LRLKRFCDLVKEINLQDKFISQTPEETFVLGKQLGAKLKGGEIILLEGDLGAGKTLFVKGIMNSLKFDASEVTSPTFTLVNIYEAALKVFHIDLYRLETNAGYAVDLDEILQNNKAVTIIEWAERLTDFPLPDKAIRVIIKGDGDEPRQIEIKHHFNSTTKQIKR